MGFAKLRPKRGTKTQWETANTILNEGELGIEVPNGGVGTGLCNLKIGDGSTQWNNLPYAYKDLSTDITIDDDTQTAFEDLGFSDTASITNLLKFAVETLGVDFIVEQGTTNGWTWEKRNSGKCRLQWFGGLPVDTGISALFGGWYHKQTTPFTLPFAVNDIKVTASKNGSQLKIFFGAVISGNTITTYWLDTVSGSENASYFGEANIIVDGTWK